MKGAALSIAPDLTLVDVTHEVPRHDVPQGAFVLGSAYGCFPTETVHVAVVDPGVGTSRKAVVLVTPGGAFAAPDNGLLSYVLNDHLTPGQISLESTTEFGAPVTIPVPDGCRAYTISEPAYRRQPVSDTFHGRDVFTPAAAYLASGVQPDHMGEPLSEMTILNLFTFEQHEGAVVGRVVHVDRFGNLVTNIPAAMLADGGLVVEVAAATIRGLSAKFADANGLLALVGSHGYLEIAENLASAARRLDVSAGAVVVARHR